MIGGMSAIGGNAGKVVANRVFGFTYLILELNSPLNNPSRRRNPNLLHPLRHRHHHMYPSRNRHLLILIVRLTLALDLILGRLLARLLARLQNLLVISLGRPLGRRLSKLLGRLLNRLLLYRLCQEAQMT